MSNYNFLKDCFPELYKFSFLAEQRVKVEPVTAAFNARLALESAVKEIYTQEHLEWPYDTKLFSLMSQQDFKSIVPPDHYNGIMGFTRKIGNDAAHKGKVTSANALIAVKYLYGFLKWFAYTYADDLVELPGNFNENLIPKIGDKERKLREIKEENQKAQLLLEKEKEALVKQLKEAEELAKENELKYKQYQDKLKQQADRIAEQKAARKQVVSSEFTEAQTRQHLIDANLSEAGWNNLKEGLDIEYPVVDMPITRDNPKGNGFADYVLWGDNHKPLAVIEAKRTCLDAENGRHQAQLYANCLEKMHGQRPVIFYTNGYDIYIWDDTFYSAPRKVYGFLTKEELKFKLQQRTERKDIRNAIVNPEIAGRAYQNQAIKRIAEDWITNKKNEDGFRGDLRKALLVMATGSGKTRTAAALVEVLLKHNWVKKVLFLADRNALVSQAKKSFNEHLPSITSIDLTKEKENDKTRLVFSTYPSMLNRIDDFENGERIYGVGHFDLIIVDEAHRSVYNKYKAIFDYFDALLVGLTATPKKNIDTNTFELFEREDGNPTYFYELEQAVKEKYLVDYKKVNITTKFIREGIKYKDLSEKDKKEYEKTFGDNVTGLFPEEINSSAINKWLFNKKTVFKVLDKLMNSGISIEEGDLIGRTIIFATNQKHAQFILECFQERYPSYGSDFIKVVHNKVSHSQSIIENFCDKDQETLPQIAISVDMMDTGIDAPRVLNLVFFKIVRSYAKFWQMIGRGTRLCPDIFGPNKDKKEFFIFDVCDNFTFFDENPDGIDVVPTKNLSQLIFEARLDLGFLLSQDSIEEHLKLASNLYDLLCSSIIDLDRKRYDVKMKLEYVELFREREKWNNLTKHDIHILKDELAHLPKPERVDEVTRRFDLMMLRMQLYNLLKDPKERGLADNLIFIAGKLKAKFSIKEVENRKELILKMAEPEYYKNVSQKKLEEIRIEIRDLMIYLKETNSSEIYYTNFDDDIIGDAIVEEGTYNNYQTNEGYKRRVEAFVMDHLDHLTINKLRSNIPITKRELELLEQVLFDGDERGTKNDYLKNYGEEPLGKFVRSIVGLSTESAHNAFSDFIREGNLNANQIKFVETIIHYLEKNGTMEKGMLVEPPFNQLHHEGLFGIFDKEDDKIIKVISIVDSINKNAFVG